jgi:CRISPR-associated protein Cas2
LRGEISELKLRELKLEARGIMDESHDSLILFTSRNQRWLDKEIVGKEKGSLDIFL